MDKKEIQKNRVMSYFINAADEIIKNEGIEAVTIRRVADMAGFNSATLYNYFENLEHLLFLASMKTVQEYPRNVMKYIETSADVIDKNILIWECFCKYSFKNAKIYYRVFFPKLNQTVDNYVHEYYRVYPQDFMELDGIIPDLMAATDLHERTFIILDECVEQGYFLKEDQEAINDMTMLLYKGMLLRVMDNQDTVDIDDAIEKTIKYIANVYAFYRKKQDIWI